MVATWSQWPAPWKREPRRRHREHLRDQQPIPGGNISPPFRLIEEPEQVSRPASERSLRLLPLEPLKQTNTLGRNWLQASPRAADTVDEVRVTVHVEPFTVHKPHVRVMDAEALRAALEHCGVAETAEEVVSRDIVSMQRPASLGGLVLGLGRFLRRLAAILDGNVERAGEYGLRAVQRGRLRARQRLPVRRIDGQLQAGRRRGRRRLADNAGDSLRRGRVRRVGSSSSGNSHLGSFQLS